MKAVAEEIEVRLPFSAKHGDEEIASAAIERLRSDSSVPSGAVKVKVEKEWVNLTGEVDCHYQKEATINDIRGLWGGHRRLQRYRHKAEAERFKHQGKYHGRIGQIVATPFDDQRDRAGRDSEADWES